MTMKTFGRVAEDLQKSAKRKLDAELIYYNDEFGDDSSMRKMLRGDYRDTMKVAKLIEQGAVAKAMAAIMDMDTAAREEVGQQIHDHSKSFYNKYMIPEGWCI